jgi:small-conductance mechanosensitive channel
MFFSLLVVFLAWYSVRGAIYLLERLAERSTERRLFYKRLVPIARIVFWSLAIMFIIRGIFQVDAQGLLAAAAAIGVAIGFAAQDLLKNIFGGLVIIFDQPFQVGDKISVGGAYGEVTSIGLRSTRIVTPDDNLVTVPNSQVVDGQVSNANAGALDCQVVTDIFLPGWVDETRAKEIAYQAAASSRYVYLKKPIVVLVKDVFDNTFLTRIRVKAYVLDIRYEFALMSDVTERARAEFRREGLIKPTYGAVPGNSALTGGDGHGDADVVTTIGDDTHESKDA